MAEFEQLSDEYRRILGCLARGESTGTCSSRESAVGEALRLLDAHAAERAALEAVIERVREILLGRSTFSSMVVRARRALAGAGAPDTYERGIRDASGRIIEPHLTAEQACERLTRDLAAANARVAELECEITRLIASVQCLHGLHNAANARAEAAERTYQRGLELATQDFQRKLDDWRAKCEAAAQDAKQAWEEVSRVQQVGLRAESEAASLRQLVTELRASFAAQCEKTTERASEAASLRADLQVTLDDLNRKINLLGEARAEVEKQGALIRGWELRDSASLAAAIDLLAHVPYYPDSDREEWVRRRDDLLANAPAASTCNHCGDKHATDLACHRNKGKRSAPTRTDETNLCWKCGARKPTNFAREDGCSDCGAPGKEPTRTDHEEVRQYDGHAWVRLDSLRSTRSESCPFGRDPCDSCTCWQQRPTRTDHERAVLEACRALDIDDLVEDGEVYIDECRALECDDQARLVRAVLAWREAEK
jgi:hypothetical protein